MTQAAFRATYSDFKLIKTRGVVSISFEVPLEHVDLAYQVLGGMPDASAERWCAIARLTGEAPSIPRETTADPLKPPEDRPLKARKPVAAEKRLAQQAGILCADPVFWKYLREEVGRHTMDEDAAAEYVRSICHVRSRSEITPNTLAAECWHSLESQFTAWKLAA